MYEKNSITEIMFIGFGWFCFRLIYTLISCSDLSHYGENAGAKFAVPAQQRISLRRSYVKKKGRFETHNINFAEKLNECMISTSRISISMCSIRSTSSVFLLDDLNDV